MCTEHFGDFVYRSLLWQAFEPNIYIFLVTTLELKKTHLHGSRVSVKKSIPAWRPVEDGGLLLKEREKNGSWNNKVYDETISLPRRFLCWNDPKM